jgi:hypothetical protein
LILTQTCDIDHKDHVTVARIFAIGHLLQDARDALDHGEPLALHEVIRTLTEGYEALNVVYLGALEGIGRSVADLLRVQSFPQTWKECFKKNRWMSLTGEGVKYLQSRLSTLSGRFALDEGFWFSGDDQAIAQQIKEAPNAVEQALARLEEKRKAQA